jgi:uncharacterized phage protein (TIGR01671 family)
MTENRIPAYRAWNKKLNKMQEALEIELDPEFGGVFVWGKSGVDWLTGEHDAERDFWPWDEIDLMQDLGKRDKNGKLIYESDIVFYDAIDVVGVVTWTQNYPGFLILNPEKTGAFIIHDEWEVLGNCHEHPDLLKEQPKRFRYQPGKHEE